MRTGANTRPGDPLVKASWETRGVRSRVSRSALLLILGSAVWLTGCRTQRIVRTPELDPLPRPASLEEALEGAIAVEDAASDTEDAIVDPLEGDEELFFDRGGQPTAPADDAPQVPLTPLQGNWQQRTDVRIEPGVYKGDDRFRRVARAFPRQVRLALMELANRAGIGFAPGAKPIVTLAPLRNEQRPAVVRTDVVSGRRRARITINVEPLAGGLSNPQDATTRALAAGIFELVRLRHRGTPAWLGPLAASLALGPIAPQIERLHRQYRFMPSPVLPVSNEGNAFGEGTALAIRCLLQDRDLEEALPRLLAFALEGDDAEEMLSRLVREPEGMWIGVAREALVRRFETHDPQPWVLLVRAEEALATTGRAGLEAILPAKLPAAVSGELKLLRARAALAEGDYEGARGLLTTIGSEDLPSLRDPAEAVALHVEVESAAGGDPARARYWVRRLDLDHPRCEARLRLRRENPLLGFEEDPIAWFHMMRRRIRRHGAAHLDYDTIRRILRVAILDHRPGGARALLERLGSRADAPELGQVVALLDEAETNPSAAARAAQVSRVQQWIADPTPAREREVDDGGVLAFEALQGELPPVDSRLRRRIAQRLTALRGPARAVRVLAMGWAQNPALIGSDLEQLAARSDAPALRAALNELAPAYLTEEQAHAAWLRLSYALESAFLASQPDLLRRARHPDFGVRLEALGEVSDSGKATPELVGAMTIDPVVAVRRRAVEIAGRMRFGALTREALDDPAPSVREAAVIGLAMTGKPSEVTPTLLRIQQDDSASAVRLAASRALAELAPRQRRVLAALVATQLDRSQRVRDAMSGVLQELPKGPLAFAIHDAVQAEAAATTPRAPYVARLVLIFQRAAGIDLRHEPQPTREQIDALADRMLSWARRRQQEQAELAARGGGALGPEDR